MLRSFTSKRSLQSLYYHHHFFKPSGLVWPWAHRLFSSTPGPPSSDAELRKYIGYTFLLLGCGAATYYSFPLSYHKDKKAQLFRYDPLPDDLHTVTNWSGTHEVRTRTFLQPESIEQLEGIVNEANVKKHKVRPVGSGLSPNGIGLTRDGMVNLALMDKVLSIDKEKKTVTVQAGIRVQQLVDQIKAYGITLQNFASIREQQIGGIVQHEIGYPRQGDNRNFKRERSRTLFLARCGLGGLGVVAEVTLQCVERQELVEHTFLSNMKDIKKHHKKFLSENKHVKYLHIPYTDAVVVVTCNPVSKLRGPPNHKPKYTTEEALQHVRDLYREASKKYRDQVAASGSPDEPEIDELSFTELRDKLLAMDPLNKEHVIKVNKAEAEYWRKSEGYRVGWSDEILGFDCGGHQWVSESCFPAGTLSKPSMKDVEYIEEVMQLIEKESVPAPAPIEQRWTACSKSRMSPAYSVEDDDIFSWVGIIMYLPTMDARQRRQITEEFFHYRHMTQEQLWDRYSAFEHWAKIEVPKDKEELAALQARLKKKFPVDAYNQARKELDPNHILSNNMLEKLFPSSESE
ncbi:unnamed protein product [Withania somnifera]